MIDLVLIVAMGRNGVIGRDNALPWHIPADLRRFKRLTVGKPVIMGRKTFESIGKPLPGRHNIVLSRDPAWTAPGVSPAANLAEAVAAAGLDPRARAEGIFVIGGASVYAEALPSATRLEITEVDLAPEGDTLFPAFDRRRWRETGREAHAPEGDTPGFAFVTLQRAAAAG